LRHGLQDAIEGVCREAAMRAVPQMRHPVTPHELVEAVVGHPEVFRCLPR
jgi:hypothetical protein